jgi:hypothetical protein
MGLFRPEGGNLDQEQRAMFKGLGLALALIIGGMLGIPVLIALAM